MAEPTRVCEGVYAVDTELLGVSEFMAAYVVDAERPAVVDPGAPATVPRVLEALESLGIDPGEVAHVLPTHVHLDHAGGTGDLAAACPAATVHVHERGRPYLVDGDRLDRLVAGAREATGGVVDAYGTPRTVDPGRCVGLDDGATVDLGDRRLKAVPAPGHAPHQVCLLDSATGALFAGDAAGMSLSGRLLPSTPPPDFDPDRWGDTLQRLRALDPDSVLYAHFGAREDADGALREYAELLPDWIAAVREHRAGRSDPGAIAADLPDRWRSPTLHGDVAGVLRYLDEREG